ncbi:MAG: HAD-IA family hydrolase, partial [Clostridia bacterium]|nr:HAD-IA family hydrolase [Clostridia bacterium]
KEKGIKLAVVTADDAFTTEKCLKALGIDDMFDVVYTDDGTHPNKPDPYCIEDFCAKYGLSKGQVVMVGDSLTDVNFAKNGGVKFVGVAKGEKNTAFLSAHADTVLPDISHLSSVLG